MAHIMKALRRSQLKREISNYEMQEVKISKQIQDLSNYASNLADGIITYSEMASCPSSLFGTQLGYLQNSSDTAYQSANVKTTAYLQQLSQVNGTTGNQYLYAMGTTDGTGYDASTIFNEIYKEELKEYANQISETVNSYEEALEQEKERISTLREEKEAELQTYDESISQSIQDDAIKLS